MSENMAKEETRLKYIDSTPAGEDLFAGKSQEKIAKSIGELIKNNDKHVKLIGLEGVWGSGKSNLIKILEELLKKTHHVFTYDAWGHQEDLQRRSLLEGLGCTLTLAGGFVRPKSISACFVSTASLLGSTSRSVAILSEIGALNPDIPCPIASKGEHIKVSTINLIGAYILRI
jgi:hypothetical protein